MRLQATVLPGMAANKGHPLNRELRSWWLHLPNRAGGGGLTWRDLMGRNHGTFTSMDPPTDWEGPRARKGGFGAVNFDNSNDSVNCALALSFANTQSHYHAAWIYPTATGIGTWGWICSGSNGSTAGTSMVLKSSDLTIGFFYGGGGFVTYSAGAVSLNTWSHVATTWNASDTKARFYINGKLDTTTAAIATTWSAASTAFGIGRWVAGGAYTFPGSIDDVREAAVCPSDAQMLSLYRESAAGYPNALNWIMPGRAYEQAAGGVTSKLPWHLFLGMGA